MLFREQNVEREKMVEMRKKKEEREHTIKLGGKYGQRICGEYTYMYSSVLLTSPTRGKNKLFLGGWGEGAVVFRTI
jgi:restriction endonuclease Mrr